MGAENPLLNFRCPVEVKGSFFSSKRPQGLTPPTLSLRTIEQKRTSVSPSSSPNPVRHEARMNDYRTDILFDLRRSIRTIHPTDSERQQLLHENLGFWLAQVSDVVEQRQWMELFALELVKTIPGLHEDYVWAALRNMIDREKVKK